MGYVILLIIVLVFVAVCTYVFVGASDRGDADKR